MNIKELAENLGLEEDEYMELIELFIEKGNSDLDELQSAVCAGDSEKAAVYSHSMKSASGNLGLMEIYEAVREIEENARGGSLEGAAESTRKIRMDLEEITAFARC